MKKIIIAIIAIVMVVGIYGVVNMPKENTVDIQESYIIAMQAVEKADLTDVSIYTDEYGTTIIGMDGTVMCTYRIDNTTGLVMDSAFDTAVLGY